MIIIVIKPNLGVDLVKESGPELHGLTRVKPVMFTKLEIKTWGWEWTSLGPTWVSHTCNATKQCSSQ